MALDITAYAASKRYTDVTVEGGGAIKGKNCTIDSITPITGGNEVTFKWTLDDGTEQTDTMDVMDGEDGKGIKRVYVNEEDHLIIVYDDDTTSDAGEVIVYSSVDSVNGKTGVVTLDLEDVVNVGSNLTYDSSTNTLSADAQEITVDSTLSDSSENPVQNKVVKGAIDAKQDSLTFDDAPTQNSNNPVKSGGVYTAISGKQDALTFDNTPTENSTNPVKSGGVYSALAGKANTSDIPDITGKADKVASAVSGNFAGLDGNGNLTDSGSKASDFLTQHQDITGKTDKVTGATSGHFAGLDSNGNLTDSGKSSSDFAGQVSSMPTASSSLVGKVYQFIGTTDSTYTHGYFYECVGDSDTYSWENVPVGAGDTQIQSDWNQTDNTQKDYIKNKPTIPSAQVNSDWTASSGVAEILHKPTLGTASALDVATSGNASTSQVVKGDDTRLTDSRNAADVYSWAKAENKPSYTASEVGAIASTDKGANNGVAELDSTGKVPSSQLPSYVDDVLEYNSQSAFPSTGETGKIYIAKDTNKTYRWSGTAYVEISESLALGETSSTAYAGNKGKANADAISAIKDGSTIDSFGDVESALSDKISKSSTAGLLKNDGTVDTNSYATTAALSDKVDKVTGKGLSTNDYTDAEQTKLSGIASGAEVNVQSDWNVTDDTSDAFIKNKPTIPAAQVNSDWNASSGVAKILNKPNIPDTSTCYQTGDTAETALADGDYIPFYDTSASGKRKSLWSNIKSVLKTYFDTLYSAKATSKGSATKGVYFDSNGAVQEMTNTLEKSVPSDAVFTDTNNAVTQTNTTGSADYRVLLSENANDTTQTVGARKSANLKFNPSTGNLQATQLNGVTIGASPKFTDTTYESKSASSGGTAVSLCTTGEKYTWNGKADKAVPSANGNVATLNSSGNLADSGKTLGKSVPADAVFTDTTYNVVSKTANGLAPQLPNETSTTKYLRQDGTWVAPPNDDTKNTAGSTDSSSKLFLIGATSQAANPQTYSQDTAYVGTDGCLYSNSTKVLTAHQDISGKADKVSGATNGNLAALDANGNLTDSGKKVSDFVSTDPFYIFMSDSYDDGVYDANPDHKGWISQCAVMLGLSSSQYTNQSQSGGSFVAGTWLSKLTSYRNSITEAQANAVTHIVIGGGINDCFTDGVNNYSGYESVSAYLTALFTAVKNVAEYAQTNYPNAKVYLCFVGYALETSSVLSNRNIDCRDYCYRYMREAASDFSNMYCPVNTEFILHYKGYLYSDGLHPNNIGTTVLARGISQAIKVGTCNIEYAKRIAPLTISSGFTSNNITVKEYFHNERVQIEISGYFQASSKTLNNSLWDLGELDLYYCQRSPYISIPITIQASGNKMIDANLVITGDRHLKIRSQMLNASSWAYENYSVNGIVQLTPTSFEMPSNIY